MSFGEVITNAAILLVIGGLIAALVAWIGSFGELYGLSRLEPSAFDGGPVLLERTLPDFPAAAPDLDRSPVRTRSGWFRTLAGGRILFAPRIVPPVPPLSLLNFGAYKGAILRHEGATWATVRAPWSTTLLGAAFITLGLAFALVSPEGECRFTDSDGAATPFSCTGPAAAIAAFVVALAWARRRWSRRRALRMIDEIRAALLNASGGVRGRPTPSASQRSQ